MKTKLILAAITTLLAGSGLIGYNIVKTKDFSGEPENLHKVLRVIDGDTFEIAGSSEEDLISVRILNISAPEKAECYFEEATNALKELILDKEVRLERDISGTDRFGRLLRHVFLPLEIEKEDDIMLSKYMIDNGFAVAIPSPPDFKYKEYLSAAEGKAKQYEKGAWGDCENLPNDFKGTADSKPDDPECIIKGNISVTGAGHIYFLPQCPSYSQVKIDSKKGEAYFCTEEEAQKAGFSKSPSCANTF
ncbi:MAG: thermonuclease family protein [Candidatus Pacebacteria bacterium]|nr:thermonuclease family protein [Candidatus Paceibacterota bacterium]